MNNIESIGKRIDDLRIARGWTKEELAKRANLSYGCVCDHINTGKMTLYSLIKYAEVLGCSGSDLLDDVIDLSEFNISTDLESHYPFNLSLAVVGGRKDMLWHVYPPAIEDALKTLTEREQKVLELRYQKGMTLQRTSEYFGISRERIRQVEAKALRKLRHPFRFRRCLLDTTEKAVELEKENSRLRLQNVILSDKLKNAGILSNDEVEAVKKPDTASIDISDMELSVRSYNCLRRTGINTLYDLTQMSMDNMMKVRNLGRRSLMEIIDKMKEYGVTFKDENN